MRLAICLIVLLMSLTAAALENDNYLCHFNGSLSPDQPDALLLVQGMDATLQVYHETQTIHFLTATEASQNGTEKEYFDDLLTQFRNGRDEAGDPPMLGL